MTPPGDRGARVALTVLVVLVIVSPWPMGGAAPWAATSLTLVSLGGSALALGFQALSRSVSLPPRLYWPLYGLVALSVVQLVPLPSALHALVAPGSSALWHPNEPAAASVLGTGWRPISVRPYATIQWTAWALGLLMLSSLAAPALRQRRQALRATVAILLGGLVLAVYGIVARTLFGPLLFGMVAVPTVSPFGPFVSKNHFAGYVEMVALLAVGTALGLMDRARRGHGVLSWVGSSQAGRIMATLGVATALALAVPVSQSRGGVLSLMAGLASLIVLRILRGEGTSRPSRRWMGLGVLTVLITTAALVVLPREAQDRLATLTSASPDNSGTFRLGLWRDTMRAFGASPVVGHGLGAFQDALPPYKQGNGELRVQHAENEYLELLVEGGVIATMMLAALLWLLISSLVKDSSRHGVERGLRIGATAAGVALAVHACVDFNLHIPASACLACFLLALLASGIEMPDRPGLPARLVGVSGILVLALVTAGLFAGPAASAPPPRDYGSNGLRARESENRLRLHLREQPSDAEAWAWLAWLRASGGAREEGAALAAYAARLDPTRPALRVFEKSLASSRGSERTATPHSPR